MKRKKSKLALPRGIVREIADETGVCLTTVYNVLGNKGVTSDALRHKVAMAYSAAKKRARQEHTELAAEIAALLADD